MAKSYVRGTASGSTDVFSVPFPYLDKSHVHALVNGTSVSIVEWVTSSQVRLLIQPEEGDIWEVRRVTPTGPVVTFQPGNLDTGDMNLSELQALYLVEELEDARSDLEERVVRVPVDETIPTLPARSGRKEKYLRFDASGNPEMASATTGPDWKPKYAKPGTRLIQRTLMRCKRGTGDGGLTPLFEGATRAFQGATKIWEDGEWRVVLKQRVSVASGETEEGFETGAQIFRFVVYRLSDIGLNEAEPLYWTDTISLGHQALGAYTDADGQIWLWTSIRREDAQVGRRRGITRIRWRGADTTQDDCTDYQLWAFPEVGASTESVGHYARFYYGDSALCSADGKWVALVGQNIGDAYRSDATRIAFIYDRAELEAAGPEGSLAVNPVVSVRLYIPDGMDSECFQDFHLEDDVLYAFTGQSYPLTRHYIISQNIWSGDLLLAISVDDARGNYTREELRGQGALGIPSSMETEGGFLHDGWPVILTHEVWVAPGCIVSNGDNPNMASLWSANTDVPGWTEGWLPVWLDATHGEWAANYSGGYPGAGVGTARFATVVIIKDATGEDGEQPIDRVLGNRRSTSVLPLPRAGVDLSLGMAASFSAYNYSDVLDRYYPAWSFDSEGNLRLYDGGRRGDRSIPGRVIRYARTTSNGFRSYLGLHLTRVEGTDSPEDAGGYGAFRIYASNDAVYPNRVVCWPHGSALPAAFDWSPAYGMRVGKAGGGYVSIDALNTAVNALGGDVDAVEIDLNSRATIDGANITDQPTFRANISAMDRTVLPNPCDAGAVGDGTTDDTTDYSTKVTAAGAAFLPQGKVFLLNDYTSKHLVGGPGSILFHRTDGVSPPDDTAVTGFQVLFDPIYGNIVSQPQHYGQRAYGPHEVPPVDGTVGNPHYNVIVLAPGSNPLYPFANDPTRYVSGRWWESVIIGGAAATLATSLEKVHVIGTEVLQFAKWGHRIDGIGSNGPQWLGQDLSGDAEYYRHPYLWDGSAVTPFDGPGGLVRFDMETKNPGIGAKLLAKGWGTSSRDDCARISYLGRDAALSLIKGVDILTLGYRAGCGLYYDVADVVAVGPYSLLRGALITKATALGSHAGEDWQEGAGTVFVGFQAGTGNVITTDSLVLGRNAAYGIWAHTGCVFIGPYSGQNLTGYTSVGSSTLTNVFLLDNSTASSVPLLAGNFAAFTNSHGNSVSSGVAVNCAFQRRLGTLHVANGDSGLTAVAAGASVFVVEGSGAAGATITGTGDLSLTFARPAITSPAVVAERTYAAYIRASQDSTTGVDDMIFGLNGSGVGRWRQGGHFLIARSSELTSATGAGYVFNANGQSEFFRSGTSAQAHIRIWNDALGTPTLIGAFVTSGSKFIIRAGTNERIAMDGTGLSFFGATPIAKPTVSGSWAGNAAGQSLAAALASFGLIINSTTA